MEDLDQAIRLEPQNSGHFGERANIWQETKDFAKQIADLSVVIKRAPRVAIFYAARGQAFGRNKEYGRAMEDFDQAIRLRSEFVGCDYGGKAWISATCPDPSVRDGKKAITMATRGCELNGWKSPFALHCLAAAYAESGDFAAALNWQQKAIDLVKGDDSLRGKYLKRLAQFQIKQPYREEHDN